MRLAGHVACIGEMRNVYATLVEKSDRKRPLGRPSCHRLIWVELSLYRVLVSTTKPVNTRSDGRKCHAALLDTENIVSCGPHIQILKDRKGCLFGVGYTNSKVFTPHSMHRLYRYLEISSSRQAQKIMDSGVIIVSHHELGNPSH
jgi:hypothetical protein